MKSTRQLLISKPAKALVAAALAAALTFPAAAQEASWIPGNDPFVAEEAERNASLSAASASVGTSEPQSVQADANHQGANPANLLCDSQQGDAREQCLAALSAGGGLQQGAGDGD